MSIEDNIMVQSIYREESSIIWCTSKRDAFLYRIDFGRKIIEDVMPLLDEVDTRNPFAGILKYKDFLVFIPKCSNNIVVLNLYSLICERIPVPNAKIQIGVNESKFSAGIIYENCIYMFGGCYPGIIKFDLLNKEITVIDIGFEDKNLILTNEKEGYFSGNYYLLEDKLFLPFMSTNAVMILNLSTEEIKVCKVGDSFQQYHSIEWDGKNFWLLPREWRVGSVIKWNPISNHVQYYREYPKELNDTTHSFYKTVNVGAEIFLFFQKGNINIRLDIFTGEMRVLPDIYNISQSKGAKYPIVQSENEKIFFLCQNQCVWWDYISDRKEYLTYHESEKIKERYRNKQIKKYFSRINDGIIMREKPNINLISLIKYLNMMKE